MRTFVKEELSLNIQRRILTYNKFMDLLDESTIGLVRIVTMHTAVRCIVYAQLCMSICYIPRNRTSTYKNR